MCVRGTINVTCEGMPIFIKKVCLGFCKSLGMMSFAAQIRIPIPNTYLGCGYKGLFFFAEMMVELWKTVSKNTAD